MNRAAGSKKARCGQPQTVLGGSHNRVLHKNRRGA